MLVTILAILAVDFPVFPRTLAECETYGVSLVRSFFLFVCLATLSAEIFMRAKWIDGYGRRRVCVFTGHRVRNPAPQSLVVLESAPFV
jgi:hypothetical protein